MMPKIPTQVFDYLVVPLEIDNSDTFTSNSRHYMYARPHDPKEFDPDSPRSLFVVNVPIDSTEVQFRSFFSSQGLGGARVERVTFGYSRPAKKSNNTTDTLASRNKKRKRQNLEDEEKAVEFLQTWDRPIHRSGSSAIIVFVDGPSKEIAWRGIRKSIKDSSALLWPSDMEKKIPLLGSKRTSHSVLLHNLHLYQISLPFSGYLAHHTMRYPSSDTLQSAVDDYMTQYAAMEAARSRALSRARAIPDADGFITVTRGGRVGPARLEEANEAMEKQKEKERASKEGMEAFYRFQVREKNKERAGELVKAFEQDRKRVEEMRKARRGTFKPM